MQPKDKEKSMLKYISLLSIRIIKLIYQNKVDRAKHLQEFKEHLKTQLKNG